MGGVNATSGSRLFIFDWPGQDEKPRMTGIGSLDGSDHGQKEKPANDAIAQVFMYCIGRMFGFILKPQATSLRNGRMGFLCFSSADLWSAVPQACSLHDLRNGAGVGEGQETPLAVCKTAIRQSWDSALLAFGFDG